MLASNKVTGSYKINFIKPALWLELLETQSIGFRLISDLPSWETYRGFVEPQSRRRSTTEGTDLFRWHQGHVECISQLKSRVKLSFLFAT